MVYQGSKSKLAKYLVPIIQGYIDDTKATTYIEPFVGGGNIIDKIKCDRKIGLDINDDLICLLKYVQSDNNLSIAPTECSFEHYRDVRSDVNHEKYSQEYRALIGFCSSYGGRYFYGGYGRDPKGVRCIYRECLSNIKNQAPALNEINFLLRDYKSLNPEKVKDTVIYCDPPYRNTKKYTKQSIDYDEFYAWCKAMAKNNIVLVSEYNMPEDDFECIWSKERKVSQDANRVAASVATEKLYIVK